MPKLVDDYLKLVPPDFVARSLALSVCGLLVAGCAYGAMLSGSTPLAPLTIGLMALFPLLFSASFAYLAFVFPLREHQHHPHRQPHRPLVLLCCLNFVCALSLLHATLPNASQPHVEAFLLALPPAFCAGLPVRIAALITLNANLVAAALLSGYLSPLYGLQLLSSQVLVYLLFALLINEFRHKTIANLTLAQLQATQQLMASQVEQATRQAIARDLHDELGHLTTAISNNLNQYCHTHNAQDPLLQNAKRLTHRMADQVRTLSHAWQAPTFNLKTALEALAEHCPRPRIVVDLEGFDGVCSATLGDILLRCCQEVITNSIKHSNAQHVHILIIKSPTHISASLEDDGTGQTQLTPGMGLNGIRTRIQQHGGQCHVALNEEGFRLQLSLPAL